MPAHSDPPVTDADFSEMLAAKKRQVSDRLEHLQVFRDLDPERRDHLTDIVLQLSAGFGLWQDYPQSQKWIRIDQRFGSGHRRKFNAKVKKALAAVDDALEYVSKIEDRVVRNEFFARTLRNFATPHLEDAKKALQTIPLGWRNFMKPVTGSGFENPKREARAALMAFFAHECGLTSSEASVRTARIGNELLGWKIHEYDHHDSANPKRSRAVLKSIARQAKHR